MVLLGSPREKTFKYSIRVVSCNKQLSNQSTFSPFPHQMDFGNEICKLFLQNVPYFNVRHILGIKIQHQIEYSLSLNDFA